MRTYDDVNKTGVQHAGLRFGPEGLDEKFLDLVDELNEVYYKFWKEGVDKAFLGYDRQSTVGASKLLFDTLHGAIWHCYMVVKHLINKQRPSRKRVLEEEYRFSRDEVARDLVQQAADQLKANPSISKRLQSELVRRFDIDLPWADLGL